MKTLENDYKLSQIESLLSKNSYLSKTNLPGSSDGKVFQLLSLKKRYPNRKVYPQFYHWYIVMCQFSQNSRLKWIDNGIQNKNQDPIITEFIKAFSQYQLTSINKIVDQHEIQQENQQKNQQKILNINKAGQIKIQYTMDIILKNNTIQTIAVIKQKLQQQKIEQLIDIKIFKQKGQIRIIYKMNAIKCQQLKDKVSQWQDVQHIQIRKDKKLRAMINDSNETKDNMNRNNSNSYNNNNNNNNNSNNTNNNNNTIQQQQQLE